MTPLAPRRYCGSVHRALPCRRGVSETITSEGTFLQFLSSHHSAHVAGPHLRDPAPAPTSSPSAFFFF